MGEILEIIKIFKKKYALGSEYPESQSLLIKSFLKSLYFAKIKKLKQKLINFSKKR